MLKRYSNLKNQENSTTKIKVNILLDLSNILQSY